MSVGSPSFEGLKELEESQTFAQGQTSQRLQHLQELSEGKLQKK
jgi:hypothetical protein